MGETEGRGGNPFLQRTDPRRLTPIKIRGRHMDSVSTVRSLGRDLKEHKGERTRSSGRGRAQERDGIRDDPGVPVVTRTVHHPVV